MVLKKLKETFDRIESAEEVVGFYEFDIKGKQNIPKLKVKVYKSPYPSEVPYLGVANLEVKGKGCATHYRSIHRQETKEEAVKDAVTGFFAFFSDEADIREVKDW